MKNKKKNKINSVQLFMLKNKALALRKNYQMPYYLTNLINELKLTDSVDYVKHLMFLTKKFLRVKNYYKDFHDEDVAAKDIILKYLADVGF